MAKKVIKIKFRGIDSWNRPIFKSIDSKDHFGSTWNLFGYDDDEIKRCLEFYSNEENLNGLVYFGNHFDCEPMGMPLDSIRLELAE